VRATFSSRIALVLVLVVGGCLPGCGRPRRARYTLSGNVVHHNKPVAAGRVVLEPDGSRDNRGPAAYAVIIDGRFETPPGMGHVGGPHRVVIQGFTMPAAGPGVEVMPKQLFSEYVTAIDLPTKNSTQEFVVP
jgi:hypothetical protein